MTEPLPWRVELAPSAIRCLDRLPPRIATAIVQFATDVLPRNPLPLSKALRANLADARCARRGDYRILFTLDEDARVLLVIRIAHRADAHRPE